MPRLVVRMPQPDNDRRRRVLEVELSGHGSLVRGPGARELLVEESPTSRPPVWIPRLRGWSCQEHTARNVVARAEARTTTSSCGGAGTDANGHDSNRRTVNALDSEPTRHCGEPRERRRRARRHFSAVYREAYSTRRDDVGAPRRCLVGARTAGDWPARNARELRERDARLVARRSVPQRAASPYWEATSRDEAETNHGHGITGAMEGRCGEPRFRSAARRLLATERTARTDTPVKQGEVARSSGTSTSWAAWWPADRRTVFAHPTGDRLRPAR